MFRSISHSTTICNPVKARRSENAARVAIDTPREGCGFEQPSHSVAEWVVEEEKKREEREVETREKAFFILRDTVDGQGRCGEKCVRAKVDSGRSRLPHSMLKFLHPSQFLAFRKASSFSSFLLFLCFFSPHKQPSPRHRHNHGVPFRHNLGCCHLRHGAAAVSSRTVSLFPHACLAS